MNAARDEAVAVRIAMQGGPLVNGARIVASGPGVVAIDVDMKSKRGDVFGSSSGECPGLLVIGNEDSVGLSKGKEKDMTHIEFPEFVGWQVHSSWLSRYTLSVCLLERG